MLDNIDGFMVNVMINTGLMVVKEGDISCDISGDITKDDHSPSLDHYSPLIESLIVHHPETRNVESMVDDDLYTRII